MDEKKLIEGILKGDENSLRLFYKKYSPKLFFFIKKKVQEEKDIEEILQDTFLASLEAFRDFTFRCSAFTYLCSIAKRKIVDFYRKEKIKKILFSQAPGLEPLFLVLSTPEDKLDEKILRQAIEKTMNILKPNYKKILKLKYVEGFSLLEIAHKLSVSFKSAESMLFRARKEFARCWVIGVNG